MQAWSDEAEAALAVSTAESWLLTPEHMGLVLLYTVGDLLAAGCMGLPAPDLKPGTAEWHNLPAVLAQDAERLRLAFVLTTAVAHCIEPLAAGHWLRLADAALGWAPPIGLLAAWPPDDVEEALRQSLHRYVSTYRRRW